MVGPRVKCYLGGVEVFEVRDTSYTSGKFGMFDYNSTTLIENVLANMRFDDISVIEQ